MSLLANSKWVARIEVVIGPFHPLPQAEHKKGFFLTFYVFYAGAKVNGW